MAESSGENPNHNHVLAAYTILMQYVGELKYEFHNKCSHRCHAQVAVADHMVQWQLSSLSLRPRVSKYMHCDIGDGTSTVQKEAKVLKLLLYILAKPLDLDALSTKTFARFTAHMPNERNP